MRCCLPLLGVADMAVARSRCRFRGLPRVGSPPGSEVSYNIFNDVDKPEAIAGYPTLELLKGLNLLVCPYIRTSSAWCRMVLTLAIQVLRVAFVCLSLALGGPPTAQLDCPISLAS